MGFLDKAKKMAEQAQTKLDEVQQQFNENQSSARTPPTGAGGGPTEYDEHGRPVAQPEPAAPPPPPAHEATTTPQPDRDDEYAPPKLTSGDPLEG